MPTEAIAPLGCDSQLQSTNTLHISTTAPNLQNTIILSRSNFISGYRSTFLKEEEAEDSPDSGG
jgi:DNA polymerase I-like protein with 3'-5' exonuclease and polymerase domains